MDSTYKLVRSIDRKLILFIAFFIALSVLGRFVVHLPNFTPIGALALFAGFYLPGRFAFVLPLIVMFITDLFIGFYNPAVMVTVYLSFIATVLIGFMLNRRFGANVLAIIGGTFASAIIFFIVTNLAVWAFANYYEHTLQGLLYCFALALPFFKYAMAGDLFWVTIFFGSYAYFVLRRQAPHPLSLDQAITVKI